MTFLKQELSKKTLAMTIKSQLKYYTGIYFTGKFQNVVGLCREDVKKENPFLLFLFSFFNHRTVVAFVEKKKYSY